MDGGVAVGRQGAAGHVDAERAAGNRAGMADAVTVRVTVSPFCTSPPTVPVMAIVGTGFRRVDDVVGVMIASTAIEAAGASVSTP